MIRLIIVEDEDFIRRGLVHTMDWLGMDCIVVGEAADGKEGLELIRSLKPDVVISDIRMPYLDGISMIREALTDTEFRSILLTSYAEFDYAKRAIEINVSSYLLKPVSEEDLAEAVRKIREEMREQSRENHSLADEIGAIIRQKSDKEYYVVKTLEKIVEQYDQKLSIESVSEELGVSSSYLSRRFKKVTGSTFLEILNEYRIIQSVKLLVSGQYRVGEIAEKTGFSDYKHFYSVFKKCTGTPPSEYIKG
ncbi:response regulator [Proteiniclasticum sp. C24MP]|uniref:response regulator transcription factor n=1 Tax=Proteiniclasticum sp. C24MP TaxID=3374101 RepID=UPI0037546875